MRILFFLTIAVTIASCSSSTKVTSIKLDGNNKIIFKDGDVIYFTELDSSGISFHYTDNDSIKTIEPKDKNLRDYVIEYDSEYASEFFLPFYKQEKDSLKSPRSYIRFEYNKFAEILEGKKWGTLTKYKHKNLTVKNLKWEDINELIINEKYYRPDDSLEIIIPMPKDVASFCKEIKSKYTDVKYIILFRNVYLTYNIFKGGETRGKWIGLPIPGMPSPMIYLGSEEIDDAVLIAPKIVIDIEKAKILSIDAQSHLINKWIYIISFLKRTVEEEAEFYNVRF